MTWINVEGDGRSIHLESGAIYQVQKHLEDVCEVALHGSNKMVDTAMFVGTREECDAVKANIDKAAGVISVTVTVTERNAESREVVRDMVVSLAEAVATNVITSAVVEHMYDMMGREDIEWDRENAGNTLRDIRDKGWRDWYHERVEEMGTAGIIDQLAYIAAVLLSYNPRDESAEE